MSLTGDQSEAAQNQAEGRVNGAREAITNEFTAFPALMQAWLDIVTVVTASSLKDRITMTDPNDSAMALAMEISKRVIGELFNLGTETEDIGPDQP